MNGVEDALAIYADPARLASFPVLPSYTWSDGGGAPFRVARVYGQHRYERTPGWLWDSFPTSGLPYDIAVIAALILFAHHFDGICHVSSDYLYRDWKAGLALAQRATGLSLIIPWFRRRWERARLLPAENFRAWRDDVTRVIATANIPLAGPDGTGEPILTDTLVAFNGVGVDGSEPLRFSREYDPADGGQPWYAEGWIVGSIATQGNQGKRYDIVVAAAMMLLNTHFPVPINLQVPVTELLAAVEVNDGGLGDEEWLPGLWLAADATGQTMYMPRMTFV